VAVDPIGRALLAFGGSGAGGPSSELWRYDLEHGGWSRLAAGTGVAPAAREGAAAACDARGRALFVFGGRNARGARNDLWRFDLETGAWREVPPSVPWPAAASDAFFLADDPRGRLILVAAGGAVFALDLATERFQELPRVPGGIAPAAAAIDGARGRAVVTDGEATFALDLGHDAWSPLGDARARPPARRRAGAAIDAAGRFVLFGGKARDGGLLGDLWILDVEARAWRDATPAGAGPSARAGAALGYDERGDALFLFGGDDGAPRSDLWAAPSVRTR
jgi:hypothetical protein